MKVFISWSGEASEKVASELRKWIPATLQNVRAYFTPNDIEKGARWNNEILSELDGSNYGIIVLTKENLDRPWILFESGALSTKLGARLCPLLVGINNAALKGPLALFQATEFREQDFKKLMMDINRGLGEASLEPEVFERIFVKWWPDLDESVQKILLSSNNVRPQRPKRDDQEILEEILLGVRDLRRDRTMVRRVVPPGLRMAVEELSARITNLDTGAEREQIVDALVQICDSFRKVVPEAFPPDIAQNYTKDLDAARRHLEMIQDEIPF